MTGEGLLEVFKALASIARSSQVLSVPYGFRSLLCIWIDAQKELAGVQVSKTFFVSVHVHRGSILSFSLDKIKLSPLFGLSVKAL